MKNSPIKYESEDFFGKSFLKNFFDLPIINSSNILKTNIRKENNSYIYEIDIPGYKKENVSVNYEDGYLIVEAKSSAYNSESSESYIHQERYSGTCSRSYYIGEVDESKIIAKYSDGILSVSVPDEDTNKKYKSTNIHIN